ncbi:MAG: hypothetical protein ACRD2W_12440 [Acidimicrobiales bacterium]
MKCAHCRADVLVEIRLTIAGTQFTMHSCPSCEARWWDSDGHKVEVAEILSHVAAG